MMLNHKKGEPDNQEKYNSARENFLNLLKTPQDIEPKFLAELARVEVMDGCEEEEEEI